MPENVYYKHQAPLGFEPRISCLLDRRFDQLSHGATARTAKGVLAPQCSVLLFHRLFSEHYN